jgi:tRNA 2-thiocytidine biosynthesis protein TtcA
MGELQGPGFYISKKVGKASIDYQMLQDKDKVLVAVSGGKDSLTLLRILRERQKFVPIHYDILAVHVDMGYPGSPAKRLAQYFKGLGVEYQIIKIDALKGKARKDISCFWCAWNRRKTIFETADRFGCTKVALGHHHDDIIETTLLNLFFHGEISTMSPKQDLFGGKIVVIRPLCYVEEKLIVKFARSLGFPSQTCACPNSKTSQRTKMTALIKNLEKTCPDVKKNIFRSLQRIKKEYLL